MAFDINNFVFLDTETTGLNPLEHNVLEIAYAMGDGPIKTLYTTEMYGDGLLDTAQPQAMKVNKYFERYAGDDTGVWYYLPQDFPVGDPELPGVEIRPTGETVVWLDIPRTTNEEWDEFEKAIEGKNLVGANPSFDREMLTHLFGKLIPAHHRLLDIEAFYEGFLAGYAGGMTDNGKITGFSTICKKVAIEPGDHTAAGDVRATREVFHKLLMLAEQDVCL